MYMYSHATHISFAEPFRSSQINKIELGESVVWSGEGSRSRLNMDGENTVRARRVLIEGVLPYDTISLTLGNQIKCVFACVCVCV